MQAALRRTGRQQAPGIAELARIAFVQEVAHRISSIFTPSQMQTITEPYGMPSHAPAYGLGDFKARRTMNDNLLSAVPPHLLAMVAGDSALAREQVSARDS